MDNATITIIGRIILLPIIGAFLIFTTNRVYHKRHHYNNRVFISTILATILIIISVVSAIPKPVTWWSHLTRITSLHYCILLCYITVEHITKDKVYIRILKHPLFTITTIITILTLFIDYNRIDNLGVITDKDIIYPNILYFTSYIISYGFITIVTYNIATNARKSIQPNKPITYRARMFAVMISFYTITACAIAVLVSVTLMTNGDTTKRWLFSDIYHYGKLIYFPLQLLSMSTPENTLERWTQPLKKREDRNKRYQQELTKYLYEKIIQIVPHTQLEYGLLTYEDMMIEIADARLLIWSNIKYRWWYRFSTKYEAKIIFDLIRKGTIFNEPGNHEPPSAPRNEIQYNVAVARHFQQLEA